MKITSVLFPIVVDDFARYASTVEHYQRLLGLPVQVAFQHAGFTVTGLGPIVVLGAEDPSALEVPRQVEAIFVVDELDAAWRTLQPEVEVLVAPEVVPSGGRFVVRHTGGDGRVIEYLDLRSLQAR